MSVHVIDEANRCLQCPNPRCRENGCPIHTNIPEMIRLFKENRMMEAAEMLFENNPLSMICSLVCNHGNQCEGNCVRGIKGEPIHISSIENYISDSCFERLDLTPAPSNGNLATDSHGETSLPGVFASGDVVTGAKTVVAAVAVSKQIAEDMDRYMKELN